MDERELRARLLALVSGKVYLCGKPQAVRRFAARYGAKLHVAGVLSLPCREDEEWASLFRYFYLDETGSDGADAALPTLDFMARPQAFRDGTVIVCQDGIYGNDIERLLDFYGYEYRRGYIFDFQAAAVLDGRQVLLLHGYFCFVRDLYLMLRRLPQFTERFLAFSCVYEQQPAVAYHRGLNDLVHLCGVYIYNRESRPYFFTPEQTPAGCMRISFPCVNFAGLYPQIQRTEMRFQNEYFIRPEGSTLPYEFGDREINAMLAQGVAGEQIEERVCEEDYFEHEKLRAFFRREMRIMRLYERNCDVKLADFLERHYTSVRLLNCNDHWSEVLGVECARQIAALLGIRQTSPLDGFVNPKRYTQMPVYPSVARALGLEWATDETAYYMNWGNGPEPTTFRQYVRRYCAVIGRMKQIRQIW